MNCRISTMIISFFVLGSPSFADDIPFEVPEESSLHLTDLTGDPSRADLFELIRIDAGAPAQGSPEYTDYNLWGSFTFPNDTKFDVVQNVPRRNAIFGIDISHHNDSSLPLELLSKYNIKFVFLKATQGSAFKDGKFNDFWKRLRSVEKEEKVHRGAYHFLSAQADPKKQAQTFLSVVMSVGGLQETDLPPVVDLEWDIGCPGCPDRWKGQSGVEIISKLKTWLKEVHGFTKRRPLIYTARSWWRQAIGSEELISELSEYPIWIADYSRSSRGIEKPKAPNDAPWALWQFTDSAKFSVGYSRQVDGNIFKGNERSFYEKLGVKRF